MELTSGTVEGKEPALTGFDSPKSRNAWVVFQLKLRGKSLSGLAKAHGYNRSMTAMALHRPYPKFERMLAEELGLPQEQLFPERYVDGIRIDRRRTRHA